MHGFPGRKPGCSLIICCLSRGVTLFRINLYVLHKRDIGLLLFGIAESFPGFNMAILFSVSHLLSIVSNKLCALGPKFFSCSISN